MINNNQKLQQMAIHKQNNYTSPEVTIVEFRMERGFDSPFKSGDAAYTNDIPTAVTDQGIEDYQTQTWSINR